MDIRIHRNNIGIQDGILTKYFPNDLCLCRESRRREPAQFRKAHACSTQSKPDHNGIEMIEPLDNGHHSVMYFRRCFYNRRTAFFKDFLQPGMPMSAPRRTENNALP
jgi:hypothetical protein